VRRAAKTDANQAEIVATLRMVGATVQPLHAVGGGVPDLLVGFRGQTYLIEVKDGRKPPSERRLTPDQVKWHGEWRGQVAVAEWPEDALSTIGATGSVVGR
jgi:hypothetical protein